GPLYRSSILSEWLPAIDGLIDTLQGGADVADVGCGMGTSALIMAEAFPASRFVGFDNHAGSIDSARRAATEVELTDRVRFEPASNGPRWAVSPSAACDSDRLGHERPQYVV